mgnify:CR=1 FL=1
MADAIIRTKIVDDVIATENAVQFGVLVGAQSITAQQFKAISATPSSAVFNVVVPSLETIVDRNIQLSATMTLKITHQASDGTTALPAGMSLVNYGVTDALAPFPLNSMINTIQCAINNNSITLQQSDVLPVLLRMFDPEELATYDAKTPTTLDMLSDYADSVEKLNFVLDWDGATANTLRPLTPGTDNFAAGTRETAYLSYPNNVLSSDYNRPAGSSHTHKPRGSFKIISITGNDPDAAGVTPALPTSASTSVWVKFRVTEPLFLSQIGRAHV